MNLARELSGLVRLAPVLDALPGPAYLVGGTVRDLLLHRPSQFDFDLAVVGDGESYARALADRLDGGVTAHDRFGTATVRYGDDSRIDVAAFKARFGVTRHRADGGVSRARPASRGRSGADDRGRPSPAGFHD